MSETPKSDPFPRWVQPNGISDLSAAVDEIYFLRAMLADEAGIIEAHLDYKTFPKTRRKYAEDQIERMKRAAAGDLEGARRDRLNTGLALRRIGVDDCLTNAQWAEQRGLRLVTPPTTTTTAGEDR